MLELELFYRTVESEIRRRHIRYLKRQKCLPEIKTETSEESSSDELPANESAARVRRFNKGLETALKVLKDEFKAFNKRLVDETDDRGRF